MTPRALFPLAALVLAACATAAPGDATAGAASSTRATQRESNTITAEEIAQVDAGTAYDVVQRLRPIFLRTRGKAAGAEPQFAVVYVDGVRRGGLDALRAVPAGSIRSIEYLSGPQATIRYGIEHGGGAILVSLK